MYAIVDIEAIKTTVHHCTRKLYDLHQNGVDEILTQYEPCVTFEEFEKSPDFRSFVYCFNNVHKLPFNAFNGKSCVDSSTDLKNFIAKYNINMIYYKGGHLEKDLCQEINVPCFNLEKVGAPKIPSHDPRIEVRGHWKFVKRNEDNIRQTAFRTLFY